MDEDCVLDELRFFDTVSREWGYDVVCLLVGHYDRTCPGEHEMFRYRLDA